jgi:hypothetical protein
LKEAFAGAGGEMRLPRRLPLKTGLFLTRKSGSCLETKHPHLPQIGAMTISYEDIARRAYEIWEREGRPAGNEQENWGRAEEELRQERGGSRSPRKAAAKEPAPQRAARTRRSGS